MNALRQRSTLIEEAIAVTQNTLASSEFAQHDHPRGQAGLIVAKLDEAFWDDGVSEAEYWSMNRHCRKLVDGLRAIGGYLWTGTPDGDDLGEMSRIVTAALREEDDSDA